MGGRLAIVGDLSKGGQAPAARGQLQRENADRLIVAADTHRQVAHAAFEGQPLRQSNPPVGKDDDLCLWLPGRDSRGQFEGRRQIAATGASSKALYGQANLSPILAGRDQHLRAVAGGNDGDAGVVRQAVGHPASLDLGGLQAAGGHVSSGHAGRSVEDQDDRLTAGALGPGERPRQGQDEGRQKQDLQN